MLAKHILLKKLLRSDRLWAHTPLFRTSLKRIPLYLDTHALLKSQYWPRSTFEELRDTRLAELLTRAVDIPFWKDAMGAASFDPSKPFSVGEFQKLPVVSKNDLRDSERGKDYYTNPKLIAESSYEQTSGSTGKPFGFYHDRSFVLRAYAFPQRFFLTVGDGERYPIISIRVANRVGFGFTGYTFFHVKGYNSLRHRFAELVQLARSYGRPVILFTLTSWALEIARLMQETGALFQVKGVTLFGENLSDAQQKEIETLMHTKVHMHYAMSEVGRLGFECAYRRMHINEEWSYLEIVDKRGNVLPPGKEGRIVVSVFDNHVMPFIRYDTGDRGIIEREPCPCGRTLLTLVLKGRPIKLISFRDGRVISLVDITSVFAAYPAAIRQFQIERTGDLSFVMKVIPGPRFDEKLIESITAHLRRIIHPLATITWERVDTLPEGPSGKMLYFVDRTTTHA